MGVRTDIPFCELSDREKEIVYDGPMEKRHIFYVPKNKDSASAVAEFVLIYSAIATVLNALNKVKDDKGMKRVGEVFEGRDMSRMPRYKAFRRSWQHHD